MKSLIGKKVGMTQVWDKDGRRVAVTVLEVGPCSVVQVKTAARDGYQAAQLGFGPQKAQRLGKAVAARYAKAGVPVCRKLREVALAEGESVAVGDTVNVGIFADAKYVDVQSVTKGRGFAGVMRRYGMSGGPNTHGGHSKRRPGSIGARRPGLVQKGQKLPGQMGSVTRTTQNLVVVQVRPEDNLLLVAGSVPGPAGGLVFVSKALKKG